MSIEIDLIKFTKPNLRNKTIDAEVRQLYTQGSCMFCNAQKGVDNDRLSLGIRSVSDDSRLLPTVVGNYGGDQHLLAPPEVRLQPLPPSRLRGVAPIQPPYITDTSCHLQRPRSEQLPQGSPWTSVNVTACRRPWWDAQHDPHDLQLAINHLRDPCTYRVIKAALSALTSNWRHVEVWPRKGLNGSNEYPMSSNLPKDTELL